VARLSASKSSDSMVVMRRFAFAVSGLTLLLGTVPELAAIRAFRQYTGADRDRHAALER
jgi:hypothetical protein